MALKQMLFWLGLRRPRLRAVQEITFLTEKGVTPGRELEKAFCQLFDRFELVKRAYLALVYYSDTAFPKAALCIASMSEIDEDIIVNEVSQIFNKRFGKEPFLDIIFLTSFQELEVNKVCRPFYKR